MQIFIKLFTGKTLAVDVNAFDKIEEVKEKIFAVENEIKPF